MARQKYPNLSKTSSILDSFPFFNIICLHIQNKDEKNWIMSGSQLLFIDLNTESKYKLYVLVIVKVGP